MSSLDSLAYKWHNFTYTQGDPRTRDRVLMGSPLLVVVICVFYAILIKVILKKFMENRKPYNTRFISLGLNSYLLATACYFFYMSCKIGWFTTYSWRCEPLDRSNSEEALEIVDFCYTFLIVKFTYMLETVVFMLGKKYTLVSKYHVFHHATLPLLIWGPVNYFPGGHATFFALINSITHILVLGYFVLVTAFPGLKEYTTWWKSAFNWLHIIQFSVIILHSAQLFFWNPCDFPLFILYPGVAYGVGLFSLYIYSWL